MPRPLFWGVDHDADPPTMTILVVGLPPRYVTIAVERKPTADMTEAAAIEEMAATEPEVFDVMALSQVGP